MQIKVGQRYKTAFGDTATITYRQPEDVKDPYPFVGHVLIGGEKFGAMWDEFGEHADGSCHDLDLQLDEPASQTNFSTLSPAFIGGCF